MSRFDRVILAAVAGLALTIGALSVASARLGPSVDSVSTASTVDGVSVNTQIGLTFTEPMNRHSVEEAFVITPRLKGDFEWAGNTIRFAPRTPLRYGTRYRIQVSTAALGLSGRHLLRGFQRSFTTQRQHVLFLGTSGATRNRLVLETVTGETHVVGRSDGLVTEFSLSPDRSLAVYVKRGAANERPDQIWMVSLADSSTQLVFQKSDWSISQPHFTADGRSIVFLAGNVRMCQKYYGCYRDTTGPIIEILDLGSHRVHPFHSTGDVPITNFLDVSPSGQLAYTDLGSALTLADVAGSRILHIPNLGNSLEFAGFDPSGSKAVFVGQTPSSTGGDVLVYSGGKYLDISRGIYDSATPSFSPDGRFVAFAGYRGEKGIEPIYGINVYDLKTKRTVRLPGQPGWSDWSPVWSPDSKYICFVRSQPQEAMYMGAGEVWVMRPDGKDARPLGELGQNPQWAS